MPNHSVNPQLANIINSHQFQFSMIPFSEINGASEVNLYAKTSQLSYLFKESLPGIQKEAISMFFKFYSDDIYEVLLDDLRTHYLSISNQEEGDDEIDSLH